MSEYWVSKKKYFCKYCEIYIADDVPSRQHHENGLRHKGNLERFIRGIYKSGEKQKKEKEEEKREMKRVELAAAIAYAQDIGAGHAKPSTSSSIASSLASTAAKDPPPKPTNPYANYSTAASLGYTDPDAERLAEKTRIRQSQGIAGEWEMVDSWVIQQPAASSSSTLPENSGATEATDVKSEETEVGLKRPPHPLDEEDLRAFKFRKRQLNTGLGEIYDPGLIPIKVKEKNNASVPESSAVEHTPSPPVDESKPMMIRLPKMGDVNSNANAVKAEESDPNSNSKWAKAKWSEPIPDISPDGRLSMFGERDVSLGQEVGKAEQVKLEEPEVKTEDDIRDVPQVDVVDTGIKFKKRKAPVHPGRGRREI